jgi:hypothetical protein
MPVELEAIPPNAVKLIRADFCTSIETLWRIDDNRYVIDYGLEIIEQPLADVIEWLKEVEWLEDECRKFYNETNSQVLLADLTTNFQFNWL